MWTRIWQFLWPRMGWRRYATYLRHRLVRMPGTSHSIAIGFAAGAAMSMTPFMGFHFALSAILAWLLRGNILASALGTLVGNPWTLPLIWVGSFKVGGWMLGVGTQGGAIHGLTIADMLSNPLDVLGPVLLPMLVGSIPLGLVVFFIVYWLLALVIDHYRRQRVERRHRRALALMKRMKDKPEDRRDVGQER